MLQESLLSGSCEVGGNEAAVVAVVFGGGGSRGGAAVFEIGDDGV